MSGEQQQLGVPQIRKPPVAEDDGPIPGVGLCLSGGGYRAMVFHVGALLRLNQAGFLPRIDRVSSVSGGSITAGVLGLHWNRLRFDAGGVAANLDEEVVNPLRALADRTIDAWAVIQGAVTPGVTINRRLAASYRRALFGKHTLADLPVRPEFIFDATNLQSGDLWRFSKRVEGDWRVGTRADPDTQLAVAVAASSAFPPVLSPARLSFAPGAMKPGGDPDVSRAPYTTRVVLADGGVYDNLGLEAVWTRYQTVLISDAGGHMGDAQRLSGLWPLQIPRVLKVIDNQVRDLRKRQAVDSYVDGRRTGTYWGIRSHVADYGLPDPIANPSDAVVRALAGVPTRLARMTERQQQRLINWGYLICDTALRAHLDKSQPAGKLPFAATGFG